ncbi:MAG TPA: PBP1A family penicillin-binding protein [Actinomycetota bacterium]|nr:PBP1A family penicillin-binding protein [Actinomycetota bacterium]
MTFVERLGTIRRTPLDIAIAAGLLLIGLPLLLVGITGLGAYLYFFKLSPPVVIPEPQGVNIARSSHIYAADGSLIATLRGANYRVPIDYRDMPRHLTRAAVASEDSRFFEHQGLDFMAILKAVTESQTSGQRLRGASTITQQYVGTVFVGKERTFTRKIQEAQIASQLEREVTKEKILERYLNTVYFGAGSYGVEAAANTFFGKSAKELTVSESAQLVALIPAPNRYSPYQNPARAEARRMEVLRRMEAGRFITSNEANEARRDKPVLQEARPTEEIYRYPWFVDAVKKYLQDRYGVERTFNGGLEVTTTIDPRMQDLAEAAVHEALPSPGDPYASLVSIEPSTGYVKAMVGGRDYQTEKFNIAIQGRRQPGSAFKPIVLVAALEAGMQPGNTFRGPSKICLSAWRPKCEVSNFDNAGFGTIDLRKATVNSVNTVYAQLVLKVGPEEAVDTARRMGIPGPKWMPPRSGCVATAADPCRTKIDPFPALTLGSEEVTPMEMASAFGTLAARGVYQAPRVVSRITEADGTVIEEGPARAVEALDQQIADNANDIMQGVITGGTGTRANIGRPAAGKTGTAQDFQNAWFVGYTPELSTSVWVGFKEANKPLLNVRGLNRVTGGTIPAQIWAAFMKPALGDAPVTPFADPEPLTSLSLPYKQPTGPPPIDPLADHPTYEPFMPEPEIPTPAAPPPPPPAPPAPPDSTGGGLLSDLFGRSSPTPRTSPTPRPPSPTPVNPPAPVPPP